MQTHPEPDRISFITQVERTAAAYYLATVPAFEYERQPLYLQLMNQVTYLRFTDEALYTVAGEALLQVEVHPNDKRSIAERATARAYYDAMVSEFKIKQRQRWDTD
jgi:hypothetical protein